MVYNGGLCDSFGHGKNAPLTNVDIIPTKKIIFTHVMMVMHNIHTPKLYKIPDSTSFVSNGHFHEKESLIF
jgi:hypothetical protein